MTSRGAARVRGAARLYAYPVKNDTGWLAVPDVADRLGVPASRVRDLLREKALVAVRRDADGPLVIPESFLVDGDDGPEILPTLRGTLTLLFDAGFDDDGAMAWLLASNDELGASPVDELRAGRRAGVRRAAQALF